MLSISRAVVTHKGWMFLATVTRRSRVRDLMPGFEISKFRRRFVFDVTARSEELVLFFRRWSGVEMEAVRIQLPAGSVSC